MTVYALLGRFARGRAQVMDAIQKAGHTVVSPRAKNVDVIVVGSISPKPSAFRILDAHQRGVRIIGEYQVLIFPTSSTTSIGVKRPAIRSGRSRVTTPGRQNSRASVPTAAHYYKGNVYMYMAAARKALSRARDYIDALYRATNPRSGELVDLLVEALDESGKQAELSHFYKFSGDNHSTTAKRAHDQVARQFRNDIDEYDPYRMSRHSLGVRASVWIGTALQNAIRAARAAVRLEDKRTVTDVEKWIASIRRQYNAVHEWRENYKVPARSSRSLEL